MDKIRERLVSHESPEDAIVFIILQNHIDVNDSPFTITRRVMAFLENGIRVTGEGHCAIIGQVNVWSIVLYLFKACDWTLFKVPIHPDVRGDLRDNIYSIFWSCYNLFLKVQCTTDHDTETRRACLDFFTEDVAATLRYPCTEMHTKIVIDITSSPYVEETFTFFLPLLGTNNVFMDGRGSADPRALYLFTVGLGEPCNSDRDTLFDAFSVWLENYAPKNYFTASFGDLRPKIVLHEIMWLLLPLCVSNISRRTIHTFLSSARKIIERDFASPEEEWNKFLTVRHYRSDPRFEPPWFTLGSLLEPFPELAALVSPIQHTKSANT